MSEFSSRNNFKIMARKSITPNTEVLLYADSEMDADMLYFGKVFVPDPFIAFSLKGKRIAVVSQLEFARVAKESQFDEVLSLEAVMQEARSASRKAFVYPGSVIAHQARRNGIRHSGWEPPSRSGWPSSCVTSG